jgi:3-deoxy-D-manno-octulosonate 8-phosphate phosphatase (KDO 8-P phosphatase)
VSELASRLARVRLVVFDFDGVFTDNRVWTNERGQESVACSRSDGPGLRRLDEVGVQYLIVSTEENAAVGARARKLGVECFQAATDKLAVVISEAERRGLGLDEIAYVGNDVNDVNCLRAVGLPVVPADAWPEVTPLAQLVLTRKGGEGCVRELCDEIWRVHGGGS